MGSLDNFSYGGIRLGTTTGWVWHTLGGQTLHSAVSAINKLVSTAYLFGHDAVVPGRGPCLPHIQPLLQPGLQHVGVLLLDHEGPTGLEGLQQLLKLSLSITSEAKCFTQWQHMQLDTKPAKGSGGLVMGWNTVVHDLLILL